MVHAYILIQTEVGKAAQVAATIAEIDGVAKAEDVTGPYDVIVRAEAESIDELGRLVVARVQSVDGITLIQEYIRAPQPFITRVEFVGGIRGTAELEKRVRDGRSAAAFSLYPTSLAELMAVADAGEIMPPKSTWFEPKLRSGLFFHRI